MPDSSIASAKWASRLLNLLEATGSGPCPTEVCSQLHLIEEMTAPLPDPAPNVGFALALRTYVSLVALDGWLDGGIGPLDTMRVLHSLGGTVGETELLALLRAALARAA